MNFLDKHPYFEEWVEPASGIRSFILTERVAPVQQSFYFVNPGLSPDEELLWFYTAFPPSPHRMLGVLSLNPDKPFIRNFPQAAFEHASPLITPDGRGAYFTMPRSPSVWHIDIAGKTREVCRLEEEYIAARALDRMASHLTLSADGKFLLLDGKVGKVWFIALAEPESGEIKILHEFGRHYNHAQFSPVDKDLFMIAQDWWRDRDTGHRMPIDIRIWLMDTKQTFFEPLVPQWFGHGSWASHEWWSKDGTACWIDYNKGAFECSLENRLPAAVWQRPLCHGHCDSRREYWCADENPYKWAEKPCKVLFYDRRSGRELCIANNMPEPPVPRKWYHIDPHPQFSPGDSWIIYTTTVRGRVDIAFAPLEDIKPLTR